MSLTHVTLNGVDENTSLSKLWMMSNIYKLAEWGVSYSSVPCQNPLYPKIVVLEDLLEMVTRWKVMKTVIQVGDEEVHKLLSQTYDLNHIVSRFPKIRLDFDQTVKPIEQIKLLDYMSRRVTPIVTLNKKSNTFVNIIARYPYHEVLSEDFNSSDNPFDQFQGADVKNNLGFGSFTMENIQTLLPKLDKVAGEKPYWIDFDHTTLRTDGYFDVEKATEILKLVYKTLNLH